MQADKLIRWREPLKINKKNNDDRKLVRGPSVRRLKALEEYRRRLRALQNL